MFDLIGELLLALGAGGSSSKSRSSSCEHCGKFFVLTVIAIVAVVIYFAIPAIDRNKTESLVNKQASVMCHVNDFLPGDAIDVWDTPLVYDSVVIEDPHATDCTVRSAGRDQEFMTDDDIVGKSRNLDKTKIVTEYTKEKAKGFIKGWFGD